MIYRVANIFGAVMYIAEERVDCNMPVKENDHEQCSVRMKMRFHAHFASPLVVQMMACSLHLIRCPSFNSRIEGELGIN